MVSSLEVRARNSLYVGPPMAHKPRQQEASVSKFGGDVCSDGALAKGRHQTGPCPKQAKYLPLPPSAGRKKELLSRCARVSNAKTSVTC